MAQYSLDSNDRLQILVLTLGIPLGRGAKFQDGYVGVVLAEEDLLRRGLHLAVCDYVGREGLRDVPAYQSRVADKVNMFKKLCGHQPLFSQWIMSDGTLNIPYEVGVKGELELKTRKEWGMMQDHGSRVVRHSDKISATNIVDGLISLQTQVVLNIQRELADDQKTLEDTAAGQIVEQQLREKKAKYNESLRAVQTSYEETLRDQDKHLVEALELEREKLDQKLLAANEAQEALKLSYEKLTEEKAAEYDLFEQLEEARKQHARQLNE